MSAFFVTVRTPTERFQYTAIAACSGAAIEAAIDRFGVCGVTATPKGKEQQ